MDDEAVKVEPGDVCDRCGHPFDPHVLVATMFDPKYGGLIFCDQLGCMCETTWSLEDGDMPYYPAPDEVEKLRAVVQKADTAG